MKWLRVKVHARYWTIFVCSFHEALAQPDSPCNGYANAMAKSVVDEEINKHCEGDFFGLNWISGSYCITGSKLEMSSRNWVNNKRLCFFQETLLEGPRYVMYLMEAMSRPYFL